MPASAADITQPGPPSLKAGTDRLLGAQTIDRIARFHGGGLPVVSIYLAIAPGPDGRRAVPTEAHSLIHEIRSLADDRSLDHDARLSLRGDIERIEDLVKDEPSGWFALSGETCPLCGGPTRQTPDVIDELIEAVIDEGGAIRHVRAETELREQLAAASLRFPLPPLSAE